MKCRIKFMFGYCDQPVNLIKSLCPRVIRLSGADCSYEIP